MFEMTNQDIIDGVIEEFKKIAAIPRPSGHEKAISDYLKGEFEAIGCEVVQDSFNNIIADLPASDGCEMSLRTILQSHMDMVCVAKSGKEYNPLTDPIELVLDEENGYLMADGTSLGADDGMGIAQILFIFKNCDRHGPLRAIITVDEEQSMTGSRNLADKYFTDAAYLINSDSEDFDVLTVGSAGNVNIDFRRKKEMVECTKAKGRRIVIGGILGGHSGEEINKGRGNAIRTLLLVMKALFEKGIDCDLEDIKGGIARNAIPCTAEAYIATDAEDADITAVLEEQSAIYNEIYGDNDSPISITLEEAPVPEKVFQPLLKRDLIHLVVMLHTGVFSMSQMKPDLVETSANLGMLYTTEDYVEMKYMPRSSCDAQLIEISKVCEIQASVTGFECIVGDMNPGWKEQNDSVLMLAMNEIFQEQNGFPMQIETIHAGLECGFHFKRNPNLDIVSIGVTTIDIHSPNEKLLLESIVPQINLIAGTLEAIAEF